MIGDHTDYNGGLVFPCAVNYGTALAISPSEDEFFSLKSMNFEPEVKIPLNELGGKVPGLWVNYPLGVIKEFETLGFQIKGFKCLYWGDLPAGAGLSSSASVEVVTAYALNDFLGAGLNRTELALLAQRAEKDFVGVQCGIMDQFAVAMGGQNQAIALSCDSLQYEAVPVDLSSHRIVLCDSKQERSLAASAYNERTQECAEALSFFQTKLDVSSLAEVSQDDFEELSPCLESERLLKRSRHVIYEHNRVKEAVAALKDNDFVEFGMLMNASHHSLSEDYEVSTAELDFLVSEAMAHDYVLGSRLTGAGFGGCTVSLVEKNHVDDFKTAIGRAYKDKFSMSCEFYCIEIESGVKEVL